MIVVITVTCETAHICAVRCLPCKEVVDDVILYIWKGKKNLETKTDRPFSIKTLLVLAFIKS